ncbi:MAG: acylphosphatase [Oligoflexia bacterium]|nr:acylphosphatase [Oligoflexia bacterium]
MYRWRFLISGAVQGVGFRFATYRFVLTYTPKLKGHVRNTKDGLVEIVAEGDTIDLQKLHEFALQGPTHSQVEGVEVEKEEIKKANYKDFLIKD